MQTWSNVRLLLALAARGLFGGEVLAARTGAVLENKEGGHSWLGAAPCPDAALTRQARETQGLVCLFLAPVFFVALLLFTPPSALAAPSPAPSLQLAAARPEFCGTPLPDGEPGAPCPAPSSPSLANQGGCTQDGDQVAACQELLRVVRGLLRWLAGVLTALGLVWVFLGFLHTEGAGRGQAPFARIHLILGRLRTVLFLSFVAWRLEDVLVTLSTVLLHHAQDPLRTDPATGAILSPPTTGVRDLVGVVLALLLQLAVLALVLRLLVRLLLGMGSLAGHGRRSLGPILLDLVEVAGLLVGVVLLPRLTAIVLPVFLT